MIVSDITTSSYQLLPDFFLDPNEMENVNVKKLSNNQRYPNFHHVYLTAGDEEQFNKFRDRTNGSLCMPHIDLSKNVWKTQPTSVWGKFSNLDAHSVDNTFKYMFHKFKKGIFVKIVNNKLAVFLPFSKARFVNEYSERLKPCPPFETLIDVIIFSNKQLGYRTDTRKISDVTEWYANNTIVRYEYPPEETSEVGEFADMLRVLCSERKIPDIEFFINRRDFPMITRDETEAYDEIFGKDYGLVSHKYDTYAPILSMVTGDKYADIAMPTHEDWYRVSNQEDNKYYLPKARNYRHSFNLDWDSKIPTAVFRGASTGKGVTINTNMRLKLAYMSKTAPIRDGYKLLDAGITKWNTRIRMTDGKCLEVINISTIGIDLVKSMSPMEQSNYKYIVHVDGHVSAFRLSLELSMGSVLLIVQGSQYKMWYATLLEPYVHYIPIASDLSNLYEMIMWCRNNDSKCKLISENARAFYNNYLTKQGVLDYMQSLLCLLKQKAGVYMYNVSPLMDIHKNQELNYISHKISKYPETPEASIFYEFPEMARCSGINKAARWMINFMQKSGKFKFEEERIFHKSTNSEIKKGTALNLPVLIKIGSVDRTAESIHESFIGLCCVNKLLKNIPNFRYTYHYDARTRIAVMEHITGPTFSEYIKSPGFTTDEYIFYLFQISAALCIAQKRCGFIHGDLYPWNVIISDHGQELSYEYVLKYDDVYRVTSKKFPVIIDFGKSRAEYKGRVYDYGSGHRTLMDIIQLLFSTVFSMISERYLSKYDTNNIIQLMNFVSGTKFRSATFYNINQIKTFLKNRHRFSEIYNLDQKDIRDRTPYDFCKFLYSKFDFMGKYVRMFSKHTLEPYLGNPIQIYNYIQCTSVSDRYKTFVDVLNRITQCGKIPCATKLDAKYTLLTFGRVIKENTDFAKYFCEKHRMNSNELVNLSKRILYFLNSIYDINDRTLGEVIPSKFRNETVINYDLENFKSVERLVHSENYPVALSEYAQSKMLHYAEYIYSVDPKLTSKKVMDIPLPIFPSSVVSLFIDAYEVYTRNLSYINGLEENCAQKMKFQDFFEKITNYLANLKITRRNSFNGVVIGDMPRLNRNIVKETTYPLVQHITSNNRRGSPELVLVKEIRTETRPNTIDLSRYFRFVDVLADGNCGYRAVSVSVYGTESKWQLVKREMLAEYVKNRSVYENLCHMSYGAKLEKCVAPANESLWFSTFDDGIIAANTYNRPILLYLSSAFRGNDHVFLPFISPDAKEWEYPPIILFIENNHFSSAVMVKNVPILPKIATVGYGREKSVQLKNHAKIYFQKIYPSSFLD